jgi:hypothetical protein
VVRQAATRHPAARGKPTRRRTDPRRGRGRFDRGHALWFAHWHAFRLAYADGIIGTCSVDISVRRFAVGFPLAFAHTGRERR